MSPTLRLFLRSSAVLTLIAVRAAAPSLSVAATLVIAAVLWAAVVGAVAVAYRVLNDAPPTPTSASDETTGAARSVAATPSLVQAADTPVGRLRCSQRQTYWELHARLLLGEELSRAERIEFVMLAPIVRGTCSLCDARE